MGEKKSYPGCVKITGLLLILLLSGCSIIIDRASDRFANNLSRAIVNQDDAAMAEAGIPSYLILMDAMLEGKPDNASMLLSASKLNSAYAGLFTTEDKGRAQILSEKALSMAERAACLKKKQFCDVRKIKFDQYREIVADTDSKDVALLYGLASAWAGWIQANSENWLAVAQLAQVELTMNRVVELNEAWEDGSAHMYLGVLATILPPAMGGKPDIGKAHFEKAIEISQGKNFLFKVYFAEKYARMMFERELHDSLLKDVTETSPHVDGYTLVNRIAQVQAQKLLATADDYF